MWFLSVEFEGGRGWGKLILQKYIFTFNAIRIVFVCHQTFASVFSKKILENLIEDSCENE